MDILENRNVQNYYRGKDSEIGSPLLELGL